MTTITHTSTSGRRIFAIGMRQWYATLRGPHRFMDIAVWPVFDMLLYGSIAMFVRQAGASPQATQTALSVVAGIIMWHVVYQSQLSVSTSFFEEIYARQLPSLLTTPLRPVEWVLGAALQGLTKVVVGVAAVAAAAGFLYGFNLLDAGLAIIPVMGLLLLTGWVISLVVIGLVMMLGSGTETIAYGLLFIILPLSGAFYPVSILPSWIQPVSAILPTTYTFSAARHVALGGATPWGEIGVAALGTGVAMVAAVAFAAYALRSFQRRGYISRYQ